MATLPSLDDIKQLREEFIELVKLHFQLEWSSNKTSFLKEDDDELWPDDFEYFHFTADEETLARSFRDDLLMAHISALPRATVDWLIFRRSMGYEDDTHVFEDKRYLEEGLVNNGWEFKAAIKLIDTWDLELLTDKMKNKKDKLIQLCAHNLKKTWENYSWYYDIAELKPYLPVS